VMLRASRSATIEPSARFIGGIRRVSVLREDLAALPDWRAKARLVAEHLFPSLDYMRAQYPRWPSAVLPFAYADRIARGAPYWFRRSKPPHRESA
jgi:integrase